MGNTGRSYIYASLAVLFWATVPTAFKISLGELQILQMLTIAVFTSTILLFAILVFEKKISLIRETTGRELAGSVILGAVNPFIYYLILLKAYQLLPAQIAQPLNMIWPIILVFLSIPVLKQKVNKKSFIALGLSFVGVYIISSQGKPFTSLHANINGILLATGSSVFWAIYFILNVKDKRDEGIKLFLNFFFASIYLTLAMSLTGKWGLNISSKGFASSIYIGIFEMGLSFLFWLKALQLAPSSDKISNLVYFAPFLSLVFVHFILHEPVYYTTPAGLALIIAGIIIQNRKGAQA
jgi:drug/metabolite transporter (DMT)-like permease